MKVVLAAAGSIGEDVVKLLDGLRHEIVLSTTPEPVDGSGDRAWYALRDRSWTPKLKPELVPGGTDILITVGSRAFIPGSVLARCWHGGIGYHPSLLPRHRGPDAIKWTLEMGDPITGGTVYQLTDEFDAGPVWAQEWCAVLPDDTPYSLWARSLRPMGVRLIAEALRRIEYGELPSAQDERWATTEGPFPG